MIYARVVRALGDMDGHLNCENPGDRQAIAEAFNREFKIFGLQLDCEDFGGRQSALEIAEVITKKIVEEEG